jgi:NSS family neurotransmitter:Na+ symporter
MGGVNKGLGVAVKILMPLLFIMLLVLLGFGYFKGNFSAAQDFLFGVNMSQLTWGAVLEAMGQAFFTLSIGTGAIMVYGAYMPQATNIGKTVLVVAFFDSLVAIVSGLIIFSIVFATPGIEPSAGPGLMFISLPVAFGNMSGGLLIGTVFFLLVSIAAWSSAISLLEPCVAWLIESRNIKRVNASLLLASLAWLLGLGTVFSFNIWSDYKLLGLTFFELLDFLATNVMLPLSGLLIALFVGFAMNKRFVDFQILGTHAFFEKLWWIIVRFVAPLAISLVFVMGIYDRFSS